FICSGHRDKSCSDHFVLNVASVSIEFVPDCSCIVQYYFKVLIYFIHDSITLTSSEYDISSDGAVTILLSQSSSVRTHPDNLLVLVAVSAFRIYGLRHPMKLVPLATLVHMDIKAFPSRPSVPLLITNSISCSHQFVLDVASQTSVTMDYVIIRKVFSRSRCHSQIAFPTVLMFFLVTEVRNCEDESRILNGLHRITIMACLYSSRAVEI
ncbi:hypothetical protein T03_5734, partial [Trichinella britovi]